MTISMIGIDHDRAPVDVRALFAFTKKKRRRGIGETERKSRHPRMHHSIYL